MVLIFIFNIFAIKIQKIKVLESFWNCVEFSVDLTIY